MNTTRLRFATTVLVTTGGALLGIGAFIFAPGTEQWLGLAVGAALGAITVIAFATAGRGALQRILDVVLVPICIWTLVSARTIELASHGASPGLVKWLALSAGAAIFAIGVIGLIAHELSVESDLRWALEQLSADESAAGDDTDDAATNLGPDADGDSERADPQATEAHPDPTEAHPDPAEAEGESADREPAPVNGSAPANGAGPTNGSAPATGSAPEFIPTPSGQPSLARRPMWLAPPPTDDENWRPRRRAGA